MSWLVQVSAGAIRQCVVYIFSALVNLGSMHAIKRPPGSVRLDNILMKLGSNLKAKSPYKVASGNIQPYHAERLEPTTAAMASLVTLTVSNMYLKLPRTG